MWVCCLRCLLGEVIVIFLVGCVDDVWYVIDGFLCCFWSSLWCGWFWLCLGF